MPTTTGPSEIMSAVSAVEQFGEWQQSVRAAARATKAHPTGGLDEGFDRYSNDHLDAQRPLNDALSVEADARTALRTEIAFGTDSSLDLLARLSLLHAIDRFTVKPHDSAPERRTIAIGRGRATISGLFGPHALEPIADPESVPETLKLAGVVDATIRSVRGLLKPRGKNSIEVTENHAWTEFRTLHRAGNRERFTERVVTKGILISKPATALPIVAPKNGKQGISYELPIVLRGVTITEKKTSSSTWSHDKSKLHIEVEGDRKIADIPLIAAMLAQGLDVDRFYTPFSGMENTGHKMAVVINGHELSIDPLSYTS